MGVNPKRARVGGGCLDVEEAPATTAVMAPALTEAGPQKPENLIAPPTSAAAGFLSAEQAKQVCHNINKSTTTPAAQRGYAARNQTVCQNREVLAQFVVSANVQPTEIDEQCLQGIPKDLIKDVINFKFGSGLDSLSADLLAAAIKETPVLGTTSPAIMSDPSMGDPGDMTLFNANMGPGEATDAEEIAKAAEAIAKAARTTGDDKLTEVANSFEEQMMQSLASQISAPDADKAENVEDILQAINFLNNTPEATQNLETDNHLISSLVENSSQPPVGDVPEIFGDGEALVLNALSSMINLTSDKFMDGVEMMNLENETLPDGVEMMTFESDKIPDSVVEESLDIHQSLDIPGESLTVEEQQETLAKSQPELLEQSHAEIEERQGVLERRAVNLLRRLKKIQARLVGEHAAEEIQHVLGLAQKNAKKVFYQGLASLGPKAGSARNFPELASSLSSFIQNVEKNCNAQGTSMATRHRNSCRYFGAGSKDNYVNPTPNRPPVFGVPQIKIDGEPVEKVMGPLATQLRIIQSGYDSDATESSSGGESCDEMQTYNNPHQQPLPIGKRAAWRWAQDRAAVASRWTWLQAQISDIEYKIRLMNEQQRTIRIAKGPVVLEAPPDASSVNGYSGQLPGSSPIPENSSAARCRPLNRLVFRKRKLVQMDGLHEMSKRAARPGTVCCTCDGILAPCAICTGRKDPTATQTPLEHLSVQERIAMVDPCYHPVLSFPDEVPHTLHMDAIMRSSEWQQKMIRGGIRITKLKDKDSNERRSKKLPEHRPNYQARSQPKKSQTNILTARIKRKVLKGKRSRSTSDRSNAGRKRSRKQTQSQQASSVDDEEEASALSGSSKYSSPVPSPHTPVVTAGNSAMTVALTSASTGTGSIADKTTLKEKSSSHGRIRRNSYDIDNIVIPHSCASQARPEKLPYKEIQIPKWRLCDDLNLDIKNGAVQKPSPTDNDVEDVSDEAIALRHERSEKEENKRFMNVIHLPHYSRSRPNRRAESRADSGANTPDPMSPHPSDPGGDAMSPITSPPATPSNVQDADHAEIHHRQSSLSALRRRTLASTRIITSKEEPVSCGNEEEHEQILPYEPRTFPLSDEAYNKMLELMRSDEDKIDDADTDSQESDSTESAVNENDGEDPNDPEWTVAEVRDTEKERIRPTAKR